jgi:hypothetical protein
MLWYSITSRDAMAWANDASTSPETAAAMVKKQPWSRQWHAATRSISAGVSIGGQRRTEGLPRSKTEGGDREGVSLLRNLSLQRSQDVVRQPIDEGVDDGHSCVHGVRRRHIHGRRGTA